jgi:hypothetical protein
MTETEAQTKLDAATAALRAGEKALADAQAELATHTANHAEWTSVVDRVRPKVSAVNAARAWMNSERANFLNGR